MPSTKHAQQRKGRPHIPIAATLPSLLWQQRLLATDGLTRRLTALPPSLIVDKSAPSQQHLRLYTEQSPKPSQRSAEAVGCLPELCRAFQAATGWSLRHVDSNAGSSALKAPELSSNQRFVLEEVSTSVSAPTPSALGNVGPIGRRSAETLADSISELLGELRQAREALRRSEAELAAGVPLAPHREEEKHLAVRLEAVLRAGAEAVGCHAAALYLLDDATTALKLRCSWGLPFDRLTAPARPLQGAVADLEALLGHAVVLTEDMILSSWKAPEDFPAAVCVPVSSSTTLLGTLWFFCNTPRDFSDRQTNILEVVAGRVAADLEREMLLSLGMEGTALRKQVADAERIQRNELPTIAPMLDGWDIAGLTSQGGDLGGSFHDWFSVSGGLLAVAVGRSARSGIAGALTANAVKTALRSHARYHRQAERVLAQVNLTLWTASAGDRRADTFLGFVETATGRVCCASAGGVSAILIRQDHWESLGRNRTRLGESPEAEFEQFGYQLNPNEVLVICGIPTHGGGDSHRQALGETLLADAVHGQLNASAAKLVDLIRRTLESHGVAKSGDCSILVVKRTKSGQSLGHRKG